MCNTVPMGERIDQNLRGSWSPAGGALPPHALRWLGGRIGLRARRNPAAPGAPVEVGPSALSEAAGEALGAVVGAGHVRLDRASRLGHAGGLSYADLLRYR